VFAVILILVLAITTIPYVENAGIFLSMFIFFGFVLGTFAVIARARGLTEEEKHRKTPVSDEKEIPKSPPWFICCFGVFAVVVMYILFTSTNQNFWNSMSQTALLGVALLTTLLCFGGCGVIASKMEGRERRPVYSAPRLSTPRGRDKTGMRLAKTQSQQLFWHTEGLGRRRPKSTRVSSKVRAVRGGEIIGGRFRFKVKVLNESMYTINDVTVYILSYPRDTLLLKTEDDDIFFSKIEPEGFRSPTFDFLPTQDCVRGVITAGVSFVDASGNAHTLTTEPFTIRAVCDLLQPEAISPAGFELKLQELESGEVILKVEEWTPSEMQEKTLRVLSDSNFHEVSSEETESDGVVHYKISGWAKGKYTGKNIGAEISISGEIGNKGASCRIRVAGEDDAMILPAIDDLKERLSAYLCPMCGSKLTLENVEDLKKGKIVCCPFCNVSIGR
jgi:hypothetical protein